MSSRGYAFNAWAALYARWWRVTSDKPLNRAAARSMAAAICHMFAPAYAEAA